MPLDRDAFLASMAQDGLAIVRDAIPPDYVRRAKTALAAAIDAEDAWHGRESHQDHGMVLVCPMHGAVFAELFDQPVLVQAIEAVLGEGSIVYAYTSSSMPPGPSGRNYSVRIHTDSPRIVPGYVTNLGVTIALDDFTAANGATYYLPRSQERADRPSDEEFFRDAIRFTAPAGSAAFFNARIWHRGGENSTPAWRHALTVNMVRPWMKQRIDIPRLLSGRDLSGFSPKALQKLGFLSQPPATLETYYGPPERRTFRQKTE